MGTSPFDVFIPDTITDPQVTSGAGGLVAQRFALASSYATTLWNQALELLDRLGDVDFTINWEGIDLGVVSAGGLDGINPVEPTAPVITDIVIDSIEFPYTPPDPVESDIPPRTPPGDNITEPPFSIPDPPDVTWPIFSATAPGVSDAVIPEAPTITLPAVPLIRDIVIPSPPEYNIPEFEWELPTEDLTAPEPQFVWNEVEYNSDIRQQLATKLITDLVNGGSGLPVATEQAIYDRARSRMLDEDQLALDQMLDFFAGRGYDLPPGVLAGQMLELNNKILKTREDLNNDILIQQSKLAQENTHFIINASIVNEKNLMDYTNAFQNRAFEAAKFVVQAALQIYTVKVEAYKARLSVYVAQAEVYKARIQGEIGKAEFYKAQIQGVLGSVEIQRAMIEAYKAQVGAVGMIIELYKAEMEAAHVRAQIDETRIKGFAALVQAYSAQVAAASERYRGYQAQIAGEVAKAEMLKAQVGAYAARVEAYKATIEADTMVLKQQIAINENQVEIFKARIQQYTAQSQVAVANADAQAKIEGVKIDAYKAEVMGYTGELDAAVKTYLGRIEEAKSRAEIEIKEADLAIKEALGRQELIQMNIRAAAQVSAQMAAAAIAGVSASANIQHGEQRSDSRSGAYQISQVGQSVSSNNNSVVHNYVHSE